MCYLGTIFFKYILAYSVALIYHSMLSYSPKALSKLIPDKNTHNFT